MDNNLQIFENEEFGSVRTIEIESIVWFVGKDVAEILKYGRTTKAVVDHVDEDDRVMVNGKTQSQFGIELGQRGGWLINESGLYSLVLSSKLESAKKFKHWITSEVIPSIRKHGTYMTQETLEKALYNPDFLMQLAQNLKAEQEKNERLTAINQALSKEVNTWDNRQLVSEIIRKFSSEKFHGNFQLGWNFFYKNLRYKFGMNLRTRATKRKSDGILETVSPEEWSTLLQCATSLAEEGKVDIGDILTHAVEAV